MLSAHHGPGTVWGTTNVIRPKAAEGLDFRRPYVLCVDLDFMPEDSVSRES